MRNGNATPQRLPPFVLPIVCSTFLAVFGMGLLLSPPKDYSAEENRLLTTAPALTAPALADGSYTAALGKYFSDQFPLRSRWVRLKATCERVLGGGESNGVLVGKNGYLIPRGEGTEAQYAALERNLQALATLESKLQHHAQGALSLRCAVVPRSVDVNRVHLPSGYAAVDTDAVWRYLAAGAPMAMCDLRTPLQRAAEEGAAVWYKTDHHWTSEGAYCAYVALGQTLGYTPYARDTFRLQTVSTDFLGTTYSRAGLLADECDAVTLWRYADDEAYTVRIQASDGTCRTQSGFYDLAALQTKDQYRVFLGGTNACVYVEPPQGETLPTLLLLKDSYAQSLAPFLARHFRLILIDPRSYRAADPQNTLSALIAREQPQAVLLLCGIETLCGEMDLRTLLSYLP